MKSEMHFALVCTATTAPEHFNQLAFIEVYSFLLIISASSQVQDTISLAGLILLGHSCMQI